jgi:hypothetical protein
MGQLPSVSTVTEGLSRLSSSAPGSGLGGPAEPLPPLPGLLLSREAPPLRPSSLLGMAGARPPQPGASTSIDAAVMGVSHARL